MNKDAFQEAVKVNQKIEQLNQALACFEWRWSDDPNAEGVSTNPQLIIEFDDDDSRSQIKLPFILNDLLINILKDEIKQQLQNEFMKFESLWDYQKSRLEVPSGFFIYNYTHTVPGGLKYS